MSLKLNINKILFFDIETVPISYEFDQLNENMQKLWELKTRNKVEETSPADYWKDKGGIFSEFAKVVCISFGYFKDNINEFRISSIYGDDEKEILKKFSAILNKNFFNQVCAHNGKEFDIPFICRRSIIHNLEIPNLINFQGKKPWEVSDIVIDTMQMWKFGDYKNFTSISLLSEILGIPSPKQELDGSKVSDCYYKEKNIEKIYKYCQEDVICLASVFLRFNNKDCLDKKNIKYIYEV